MEVHSAEAFETLCTLVRGERPDWPKTDVESFVQAFEQTAIRHGTLVLAAERLTTAEQRSTAPAALVAAVAQHRRNEAMLELRRKAEIMRMLDRLADGGVEPLLLKGTPLAYSLYEKPYLRSRCDTDLLIRPSDKEAASRIFLAAGYRQPNAVSGAWVSHQSSFYRSDRAGNLHTFDLHWAINNSPIFAPVLDFERCRQSAIAVPGLGRRARTLGLEHALLLACMHRAGHMRSPYSNDNLALIEGNRLVWLYDIHLLLQAMTEDQVETFARCARHHRLTAICRDALSTTVHWLRTPMPFGLLDRLAVDKQTEPSACYLTASHRAIAMAEFRAIPGLHNRLQYLTELACPPPRYILKKYNKTSVVWLPLLYFRRALIGVGKAVTQAWSKHHWRA